ncbi:MAG: hypothetical protein WCK49_10860, partial [Myxococcaceae bacterium]
CQQAFHHFLSLTDNERAFLDHLLDKGVIEPELISNDPFGLWIAPSKIRTIRSKFNTGDKNL